MHTRPPTCGIQHSAGLLTLNKTTSVLSNVALVRGGGIHNNTGVASDLLLGGARVLLNTSAEIAQVSGAFTP